jgi:hypothetical protein
LTSTPLTYEHCIDAIVKASGLSIDALFDFVKPEPALRPLGLPERGSWVPIDVDCERQPFRIRWLRLEQQRLGPESFDALVSTVLESQQDTDQQPLSFWRDWRPGGFETGHADIRGLLFNAASSDPSDVCEHLSVGAAADGFKFPAVFGSLLRIPDVRPTLLAQLAACFDRGRPLFFEFPAWYALHVEVFAEALPQVPRVLLLRHPLAILKEMLHERGLTRAAERKAAIEEAVDSVARVFRAALAMNFQLTVDLTDGFSAASLERLQSVLGLPAHRERRALRLRRPSQSKRASVPKVLRAEIDRQLSPLYQELVQEKRGAT